MNYELWIVDVDTGYWMLAKKTKFNYADVIAAEIIPYPVSSI